MSIEGIDTESIQLGSFERASLEETPVSNWNGRSVSKAHLTQETKEIRDIVSKIRPLISSCETTDLNQHSYSNAFATEHDSLGHSDFILCGEKVDRTILFSGNIDTVRK